MSLGVCFVETSDNCYLIREEFLGFVVLHQMTECAMADQILSQCNKFGLNMSKLLGQEIAGSSAMSGKEGVVQQKIWNMYPKAACLQCAVYRLNLFVNNLNSVAQVCNVIGTIKVVITFFRESTKRRSLVPNLPLVCDNRWSAKHKNIRICIENFDMIFISN